jgi:hypothetical protein
VKNQSIKKNLELNLYSYTHRMVMGWLNIYSSSLSSDGIDQTTLFFIYRYSFDFILAQPDGKVYEKIHQHLLLWAAYARR